MTEIPAELLKLAQDVADGVEHMNWDEMVKLVGSLLLAERHRTIEECAGIAERIQPSMTTTAGIVFAGAIATEIRALLK